ncbi:MAG: hypothetical protein ACREPW_04235, partial [Candidatus Binataceae bacterium]
VYGGWANLQHRSGPFHSIEISLQHKRDYMAKIASEGYLVLSGSGPYKTPARIAALLRKLGHQIDTASVEPPDDGLLSPEDARELRAVKTEVLDEEIAKD